MEVKRGFFSGGFESKVLDHRFDILRISQLRGRNKTRE